MIGTKAFLAFIAIAAALTVLSAQAPAPAKADWTAIHVRQCVILTRGRTNLLTNGIAIQYTNTAPVAVKQVTFSVSYRGQAVTITDSGSFSPGVLISHTFNDVLSNQSYAGPAPDVCRVQKVVFSNGTVSEAPPLQSESGSP